MKSSIIYGYGKTKINKQRNLGIEVLRVFLCFRIVLLHYYSSKNLFILKLKKNRFQVPCFFFISFYFFFPTISQKNKQKLLLRLERLLIPYIIHPIINWFINNIMFLLIKFNRYNRFLSIFDLLKQFIVGRGIFGIAVLWFHFNLILFVILFYIFSFLMQKYFLLFFQMIALLSLLLIYSEVNYRFFIQYTDTISLSVGNLIETFPISIIAFSLSKINFYQIISTHKKINIVFSIIFLYIISNYQIFQQPKGFSSPGIHLIFYSISLFTLFSLLPLDKNIINSKILSFIRMITKYTQGIYCLHFLFQYYMKLKIDKKGSFIGCIVLYIISYLISSFGFNVFSKTKIKYLFSS